VLTVWRAQSYGESRCGIGILRFVKRLR
jgi:hypothetical protein